MNTRRTILLLLSSLFFVFHIGEVSAAGTKPAGCVSLNQPYHRAPDNVTYYSFTIPDTDIGYLPYFRAFVPPGTVVLELYIIEGGNQMAVARHKIPPKGLPESPPSGYKPVIYFSLQELIAADQWATETLQGYLYIAHDSIKPSAPIPDAGWLYVKVGGGQFSSRYYTNFSVTVDSVQYNKWWETFIKNQDGWNTYIENVETYDDPTKQTPLVLLVEPSNQEVPQTVGTTTFSVSNKGTGTGMLWSAAVISEGNWLSINSSASGTDAGTVNCSFTANTGSSARKGTIRVTATGATGSPVDVTVTQAPAVDTSVLSVTPSNQGVSQIAGATTFSVSNTGTGTMPWTAAVTPGDNWLSIDPRAGSNSETITCKFNINANESSRTGTIRVTATGATGSPKDVTVTQAGTIGKALSPVPDTGLTKCYDNSAELTECPKSGQPFYGQDANYSINPMSYTKLDYSGSPLMVRDNVTGLIWEAKTAGDDIDYNEPHNAHNTYTWYDSNPDTNGGDPGTKGEGVKNTEDFLKALNGAEYGGYSDWRLPTIKELVYIVNYGNLTQDPWIDVGFFPNTIPDSYWTSTTDGNNASNAHSVDFASGSSCQTAKSESSYVRAVRGGQPGSQDRLAIGSFDSFDAADSGSVDYARTATDPSSGLMWGELSSASYSWSGALSTCEGSGLGGYKDWRLPTIKELQSRADFLPKDEIYWSSTTNTSVGDGAWGVSNGNISHNIKTQGQGLRLVRGVPFLSVIPATKEVPREAGTFSFAVSNTGTGTMTWKATVTHANNWLSITSGFSGTSPGTITYSVAPNADVSARTGIIRVTPYDSVVGISGRMMDPVDVTVVQQGAVLSVSPPNQQVTKYIGKTTFNVSNAGAGDMHWNATATSDGDWLSITSGGSGTNAGAINCNYAPNPSTSARTGKISVKATDEGVTGSPVDVTVTQEAGATVLSVSPVNRNVAKVDGETAFSVSNTGTVPMTWTAAVTPGTDWLWIPPGTGGKDAGTINCSFNANPNTSARTGTILVTAGTGSPVNVTVTQAEVTSSQTACMATTDDKLSLLQIPFLSYGAPASVTPYWADFLYVPTGDPPKLLFKLNNFGILNNRPECVASILSPDLKLIHIYDLFIDSGHFWVDLERISTDENIYFFKEAGPVLP